MSNTPLMRASTASKADAKLDTGTGMHGPGRGQGRHNGRGCGCKKCNENGVDGPLPVKSTGFRGTTPTMNGHVFQCFYKHEEHNQYSDTIRALRHYIDKT